MSSESQFYPPPRLRNFIMLYKNLKNLKTLEKHSFHMQTIPDDGI